MRDAWGLHAGFFNEDLCNTMIREFKKLPETDGETFNSSEDYRRSKVRWVKNQDSLQRALLKEVNIANAEMFNVDIQQEMAEMQFAEYDAEYAGKYDWHHDVDWLNPKNYDRKLSVVVQLSAPSDYEGGNFEFDGVDSPDPALWSIQGSVLIFPSYFQHRVTEVTRGTRYSLVTWVRGPRWR